GVDADTLQALWQTSLLAPGETPSAPSGCSQITPELGITATPVIERALGPSGVVYVVAMSRTAGGTDVQRLHALDLATGVELHTPQAVAASYPGAGGTLVFNPAQYAERAALLGDHGMVYLTWT